MTIHSTSKHRGNEKDKWFLFLANWLDVRGVWIFSFSTAFTSREFSLTYILTTHLAILFFLLHIDEMQELKQFLVQLPKNSLFKDDKNLKKFVYKALYYSICHNGEYLNLLFRDTQVDLDPWRCQLDESTPFYEFFIPEDYTHPLGQACGRVLQPREKVYRCADCGYDDTCVICSFCFRREDHEGHSVSVYLSQANGGMCDCGDETAFVKKLNCACQADGQNSPQLSSEFKLAIKATIKTALDYILDVANFSINTLPFIHQNINGQGGLQITSQHLSELSSLSANAYGVEDTNSNDQWYLILWNDENHDYPEAEKGIRAATGMNDQKAKQIANEINRKGRAILKESHNYTDLLKSQKSAQADGLVATISTARDYMRESIILQIFNWINDIISFKGNSSFREAAKTSLAEVLLEPGFELSKPIPSEFFNSDLLDVKQSCMINGIPLDGNFFMDSVKVKPGVKFEKLGQSLDSLMIHDSDTKLVKSRIVYLLAFEVRFVSVVRKRFTSSILPVLFIDPSVKAAFCEQYVNAYPMLTSILAFSDREEELASSSDISVQLFTCPRTNKWIFESGNFSKLIYPVSHLIEHQSSAINEDGFRNVVDIVHDIRSKREKSAIQNSIKMCIENITRVVTKNDETDLLRYFVAHEDLCLFLTFLSYFQGLSPVKRKYGDHVERESFTELYSFISKAQPISNIVYHATRTTGLHSIPVKEAVKTIVTYLRSRNWKSGKYYDTNFKVSVNSVSPFNPINSFLSFVLQEIGIEAVRDDLCVLGNHFMRISDYSLRNIVLVSQVRIGFWIRNGMTVSRQIRYLLDTSADVTFSRDLHLNQVTAIVSQPDETLLSFIDRWELSDWFTGKLDHEKTVYEHKFSFICEKFISFLYKLLVDRSRFDREALDAPNDEIMRKAISYALCEEPKSYSILKKSLPLYVSKAENFDRILGDCAEYQAPVGLYDVGIYRLRAPIYEELDPMGQMDDEISQSVFEALFTNIGKFKNSGAKKVILVPKICFSKSDFVNARIGAIFRTKVFAKLVYKLLQVSIDTGDEEYLPHLLHLLHAALLDSESVCGKNYLEKSLVTIPICNLLLSLSESSMSTSIVSKADFLLDQFVSKDGNVMDSLIDCFGEAHIDSYKHRKESFSESKRQKSTKLAQKRKAKIMRNFAKQREKFLEKNDMLEEHSSPLVSDSHAPIRNCVYCGEGESSQKPFGIPFARSFASIFWKISSQDSKWVNLAFSDYSTLPPLEGGEVYSKGFPRSGRQESIVSSSCAHGVHIHCQERARFSINFPSPCPLCHNLYDDVIPSYLHSKTFCDPSIVNGDPSTSDPKNIVPSFDCGRNRKLLESVVQKSYFEDDGKLREEFSKHLYSVFKVSKKHNGLSLVIKDVAVLGRIECLIAKTIQANEISMRIDGMQTNCCFVNETPSSLKFLIRSLIQSRVLLQEAQQPFISGSSYPYERMDDSSVCESDGVFKEIVSLLFSTNESLQTLFRLGFAKMVALTSITLCSEFDAHLHSAKFPRGWALTIDIESSSSYCEAFLGALGVDFSSKSMTYFENFYLTLERCILPFLRQCTILLDILLCERSAERDFISDSRFDSIEGLVKQQTYKYSSDPLCQVLGLPKLSEILCTSDKNKSLQFELKILKTYTERELLQYSKTLPYPNVPRLISLPEDFNRTITDPNHVSTADIVCLLCGEKVPAWLKSSHQSECSQMCLLFCPEENSIITVIELGRNPFEIKIPGPYMTAHGEIKRASSNERATLNYLRFTHLNKLWVNQELLGFATRTMYGERLSPMEMTADIPGEIVEEEFDDFEFWE